MGLDIYFKEDIANILAAVSQAASSAGAYSDDAEAAAFRQGWQACIAALVTAFGLGDEWPASKVEVVVIERPRLTVHETK